jgi:tetratricopeptide (TPR) repeat protein
MRSLANESCLEPDELQAFLCGRLDADAARALEAHVAACADCRQLLSALARARSEDGDPAHAPTMASPLPGDGHAGADADLAPGTRVGRYVVEVLLGAGGMGAVYAAQDPELNRSVALKLLRADVVGVAALELLRERLLHEAQAMAQLQHPNVVTVYDVGHFGEQIFIAMERIEGGNLAQWLAGEKRTRDQILGAFILAGHGLCAAHTAGLVHRDFKPENVLVGRDGRVRVSDFGLARWVSDGERPAAASATGDGAHTLSGALVGTPFYMAPEQYKAAPTDARTDQFSFCVALHAALTGEHPFGDAGAVSLADAVVNGRLRPPPPRDAMPRWLRRLLERGLAVDPEARFPSLAELLAALERGRGRARRRRLAAAATLLAIVGIGLVVSAARRPLLCKDAARKLVGVWDAERKAAVRQAFAASQRPFAGAAFNEVARVLDGYAQSWIDMHTDACVATRLRGEQSEELLGLRMMCLDSRRRELQALVDRFAAADAELVERAPNAVHALDDLRSCADVQALQSPVRPPADAHARARVAELRGQLGVLKAARDAGRYVEARGQARALVAAAQATQYRPLEGEALYELGEIEDGAGDDKAAVRAFSDALWAAEAGRHDELAAQTWLELMRVHASREARYAEALDLKPRVTAVLARLGGNEELEASLHLIVGQALADAQRFTEAQTELLQSLSHYERRYGPEHLKVGVALSALARLAITRDAHDEMVTYSKRALAIKERVYGPDHPEIAEALERLGTALFIVSRYDEARPLLERCLAIRERAFGPEHPSIGMAAHNLALLYAAEGDYERALALHRRAVAIAAHKEGRDHPYYAQYVVNLAETLVHLERYAEALPLVDEALPLLEKKLGPEHTRVAVCLHVRAQTLRGLERYAEARADILRSLAIQEKLYGANDPDLADSLSALGQIELAAGNPARAIAPLERARKLSAAPTSDPALRGAIDFDLARALVGAGGDRARARALAESARAQLAKTPSARAEVAAIDRWLRRSAR